jgi:hypothetical protein
METGSDTYGQNIYYASALCKRQRPAAPPPTSNTLLTHIASEIFRDRLSMIFPFEFLQTSMSLL